MDRKPGVRPSFFKLILRDFTHLLRLPPMFMQRYESNLPKKATLRIESGRTWDVEVEAMEDDMFCLSRGWDVFSQYVGLQHGEFMVFTMNDDGDFSFDVSVYAISGCKKEFHANTHEKAVLAKPSSSWKESSPLYFETVLKPYHRSRITPLRTFTRAVGLIKKERVEVVGEHCNVWVTLVHGMKDVSRVDMARGWGEFRTANRLVFGKIYSFEFKPTKNVIKVKEVKN